MSQTRKTRLPPPAPEFGAPTPLQASDEALALIALRRSASAQALAAPGPDRTQVEALLTLAARAPDHGKLFPWRFIVIEGEAKAALASKLEALAAGQPDPDKATLALRKLVAPPLAICVVSRVQAAKIPAWEQQMSAGAVCMLLLLSAQAMGYGANWITDWYSYDPQATALLGLAEGEQVAGMIYLGTPVETPLERVRPDVPELTTWWAG